MTQQRRRLRTEAEALPPRTVACRGGCRTEVPVLDAICPLCLDQAPACLRAGYDFTRKLPADIALRFAAEDAIAAWHAQQRRSA